MQSRSFILIKIDAVVEIFAFSRPSEIRECLSTINCTFLAKYSGHMRQKLRYSLEITFNALSVEYHPGSQVRCIHDTILIIPMADMIFTIARLMQSF